MPALYGLWYCNIIYWFLYAVFSLPNNKHKYVFHLFFTQTHHSCQHIDLIVVNFYSLRLVLKSRKPHQSFAILLQYTALRHCSRLAENWMSLLNLWKMLLQLRGILTKFLQSLHTLWQSFNFIKLTFGSTVKKI